MRRVKELLRLAHELGYSNRQISQSIRMPKTTVGDYLARAAGAGVRYADVAEMSEEAVEALLFQRPELPATRPKPDWDTVAAELARRGVTLMLLWEEYRRQNPDGYSYSQFRRHFLEHAKAPPEPRLRREHLPGAACEVDDAGMTLTIGTAEGPRQASVFVGCLPFSGYLYAEATWSQTAEDWLASHVRMFAHLGGVTPKLVPGASANAEGGTTSRPGSRTPASTTRSSTARITSWPVTTASAWCPRGCGAHATRAARKRACRWSKPGCWPPCAIACSSPWTRRTRRSGSCSPRSMRGR